MNKSFITYGDSKFQKAKDRLISQCENLCIFDSIISFCPDDVSNDIRSSVFWSINRGGGLWSWKPDIILTRMKQLNEGDILVYCDAGCSVYPSHEWNELFHLLEDHDIIAQRLFKTNEQYTRIEIIDYFNSVPLSWIKCFQFEATTIILKVTSFTIKLIQEWRDCILSHPNFIMDVTDEDRIYQSNSFIENRHDQAVFSAIIYKYLYDDRYSSKICKIWERIENVDIFKRQAIRATRLRNGENEIIRLLPIFKRIILHYILKPIYYFPKDIYSFNKFKQSR